MHDFWERITMSATGDQQIKPFQYPKLVLIMFSIITLSKKMDLLSNDEKTILKFDIVITLLIRYTLIFTNIYTKNTRYKK